MGEEQLMSSAAEGENSSRHSSEADMERSGLKDQWVLLKSRMIWGWGEARSCRKKRAGRNSSAFQRL